MMIVTTYDMVNDDDYNRDIERSIDDSRRWFHSFTLIDGEQIMMILLFRSKYRIQDKDDDDTINDSTLHVDDRYGYCTTTIDGELLSSTFAGSEYVMNDDANIWSNINDTDGCIIPILITTTVRRTLPSTVPSLASGYSTTTTNYELLFHIDDRYRYSTTTNDGELILIVLFRLAYRVERMYRVRAGKILSSIVLLLQSGSVHTDENDNDTTMQYDTTATMQLVFTYQDAHKDDDDTIMIAVVSSLDRNGEYYFVLSKDALTNTTEDRIDSNMAMIDMDTIEDSIGSNEDMVKDPDDSTRKNGELILLFRLAYRINRMYQAGKILSSTVLLLGPESVYNNNDYNTIAIRQLEVLYQAKYNNIRCNDGDYCNGTMRTNGERTAFYSIQEPIDASFRVYDTVAITRPVLYQAEYKKIRYDDHDVIVIMQLVVLNQGIFEKYILLFRLVYRVDRMYRVDTVISSLVAVLCQDVHNDDTITSTMELLVIYRAVHGDNNDHDTIAIKQLVAPYQDKCVLPPLRYYCYDDISRLNMISSTTQNGEYNAEEYYHYADIMGKNSYNNLNWSCACIGDKATTLKGTIQNGENKKIEGKKKRLEDRNHLRALRSEGQYKDEVYNAEERMFQEPIPSKWWDYNMVMISIYGLCLCLLLIVTMRLRLLVQSMGSVKIHKDRLNQASQTRARLESTFGSTFGMRLRTLESCIQSDVFVCSSLLKRMLVPT